MKFAPFRSFCQIVFYALLFISGPFIYGGTASSFAKDKVLIFAAASTYAPLQEIAALFELETGYKINISYAGSSTLARQIEAGAPADLFLSANSLWITHLITKKLLRPENTNTLLSNSLVLIAANTDNWAHKLTDIKDLPTLIGAGRLAIGDPDHVPVGIYAKQALQHFGVWAKIRSRLAPQSSVKNVAFLVGRGESPLGIVYKTDALQDSKLKIITEFADTSHQKIRYRLGAFNHDDATAAFRNFLLSEKAQLIFQKFGFIPAGHATN